MGAKRKKKKLYSPPISLTDFVSLIIFDEE
jgi:hypothetical protein